MPFDTENPQWGKRAIADAEAVAKELEALNANIKAGCKAFTKTSKNWIVSYHVPIRGFVQEGRLHTEPKKGKTINDAILRELADFVGDLADTYELNVRREGHFAGVEAYENPSYTIRINTKKRLARLKAAQEGQGNSGSGQ